jgi:hypothetical protein
MRKQKNKRKSIFKKNTYVAMGRYWWKSVWKGPRVNITIKDDSCGNISRFFNEWSAEIISDHKDKPSESARGPSMQCNTINSPTGPLPPLTKQQVADFKIIFEGMPKCIQV